MSLAFPLVAFFGMHFWNTFSPLVVEILRSNSTLQQGQLIRDLILAGPNNHYPLRMQWHDGYKQKLYISHVNFKFYL